MLSQVHLWLFMLLSSWAAASPVLVNPTSHLHATSYPSSIEKRGDEAMDFPASECGSPCTISFEPVTTALTVSVPSQTVWVASITKSVSFGFTPVTTTTVFQPSAQTFSNDDPAATPTITLQPLQLGSITVFGSEDMDMDIDDEMDVDHHEQIILPVEYMIIDDDPVEHSSAKYNPYNLENNCAIITMSYLMGMSLDEFLSHVELMQPGPTQPGGMSTNQIQEYLRATGRRYAYIADMNSMLDFLRVKKLGACYCRDDFSGHCVVTYACVK
ncbi:hypothetical protein N7455_005477 [Penicillium solitum]|uniref:uncharacterized protein n=1 Tax=Penicillium solitum TaxID=60172 RepID=UPI0032C486F6|nr:hypothetical protein N7455_005477 [Penicillium solitum]